MSVYLSPQAEGRSGGEPAAINGENRSIDITGIFRGEKGNGGRELFRGCDPRGRTGFEKRNHSAQTCFSGSPLPIPMAVATAPGQTALQRIPRSP